MLLGTPPQGYVGCCHAVPKIDVTARLGAIRCPALVIVGEEDPATPVSMATTMHAGLPAAELAILRSASHLSNMEQPAAFNRALATFLNKHR
jgi:3-oxoadipate enol-lactonase